MTDPRPYSAPYDMRCPIARTLDIVGERWTILILRDLVTGGPRKFQDFERSLAEHAIGAIEAAGGSRDRREAVLRAAPAARRIRTDRKGQRAAPGAADLVRLGPAPHPIRPPRQMSLGALERGQAELAANLLQPAHQKSALVHPLLDRAKRVFDRLAALVEEFGAAVRYQ